MKIPGKAFYVKPNNISNGRFSLCEEESKHALKVLRLKIGDSIILIDGRSRGYIGKVQNVNKKELSGTIKKVVKDLGENKNTIHISPALFKKSRFEILLEKATELGVKEIHPIVMNRSVFETIDLDRCKKILIASAKQCRRSFIPIIFKPKNLESLFKTKTKYTHYACHLDADLNLLHSNIPSIYPINVIIGPEGGFSDYELGLMEEQGVMFFSLGNRRLRSETAAITSLVLLNRMV